VQSSKSPCEHVALRRFCTVMFSLALTGAFAGCAARSNANRANTTSPSSDLWKTHLQQAQNAERARQHEQARKLYVQAAAAAGETQNGAVVAKQFADTLLSWGEFENGRDQLKRCVALAPNRADAWNDLGIVLHQLGDSNGAATALQTAATLAPKDPRPQIALAALWWTTKQYEKSLAQYRKISELNVDAGVRSKVQWAIETLAKLVQQPQ
jgi:tetratricopeptide (TPR) repeat protein